MWVEKKRKKVKKGSSPAKNEPLSSVSDLYSCELCSKRKKNKVKIWYFSLIRKKKEESKHI